MSFGGGSKPSIPKERHPYALKPEKTANSETARPLPYLAGTSRLGVTWLGEAYNQRTEPVESDGGAGGGKMGGGSEEQISGYDYFADVAGVVCLGPVDQLREVWMDQEKVWSGLMVRGVGEDTTTITIEDRGDMRIYWGTETQGVDSILSLHDHPAYRGMCYVVFDQLYFGQDKTEAPNIELVLTRAPLNWTGAPSLGFTGLNGTEANPIHCMVELLTNWRYGCAVPAAQLDIAQLRTMAAALNGAQWILLSPVLTEQAKMRDVMGQFCEYFEGYLAVSPTNQIRIQRKEAALTPSTLYPLIGEYDLLEPPQIESEPWTATINEVRVTFTDILQHYESDAETWCDLASRAIVGEPLTQTLDRPWCTSRVLAARLGANFGSRQSVPLLTAKLRIRKGLVDDELSRRGDEIVVGGYIRLTYLDFQTTVLMRVEEKTIPKDRSGEVQLTVVNDRYFSNVLFYTPDDAPGIDDSTTEPGAPLAVRVIEAPRPIAVRTATDAELVHPHFCLLLARSSGLDVRVAVWASEDAGTYKRVFRSRYFANYGTLAEDLGTSPRIDPDGSILLNIPDEAVDRVFPSTTTSGWYRALLLAIIGDELIAYREVEVVSVSQVRLKGIIRARCGGSLTAHATGDPVFVVKRLHLAAWAHRTLNRNDEITFKVVTGSRWYWQSLADADALPTITVANRTVQPFGPANLRFGASQARVGPFTYAIGDDIVLRWATRAWQRHGLWECWDHPFRTAAIQHVVVFTDLATGNSWRKRVLDAASVDDYDGLNAFTLTQALRTANLGASDPAQVRCQIYARVRGLLSEDFIDITVTRGATPTVPVADGQAVCWQPSGLYRLAGVVAPESHLQANFSFINAHWGALTLPYPTVSGVTSDVAAARTNANFSAIAAFLGLTLPAPPAGAAPDWPIDQVFESVNAVW